MADVIDDEHKKMILDTMWNMTATAGSVDEFTKALSIATGETTESATGKKGKELYKLFCIDIAKMIEAAPMDADNKAQCYKLIAGLTGTTAEALHKAANPFYTADEYLKACLNYDPSTMFHSMTFDGFNFEQATISYIAARPSRGKTTVLNNLAIDALQQTGSYTPRPVLFLTAEENCQQIFTRLLLNLLSIKMRDAKEYDSSGNGHGNTYGELHGDYTRHLRATDMLLACIKKMFPAADATSGKLTDWSTLEFSGVTKTRVNEAISILTNYIKKGMLRIYDAAGVPVNKLADIMTEQQPGTVVLIDYVQLLAPAETTTGSDSRTLEVGNISHTLADAAKKNNLIVIAGAQMNRNTGVIQGDPDSDAAAGLSEVCLGESDKLTQDAYNIIGIGQRKTAEGTAGSPAVFERFYKILKNRTGAERYTCKGFTADMNFYFLQSNKEKYSDPNGLDYTDGNGGKVTTGKNKRRGSNEANAPQSAESQDVIIKEEGQDTGKQSQEAKTEALKNFKYGGNK